jgi:hypothetical protein
MQIELDNLTPEENLNWEYFLRWYNDNGWVGVEARRLAWADLQGKHQRLKGFCEVA